MNGTLISSPALNVQPNDRIVVDGKELRPPEPARLWLYHKPLGLVTTTRDEQGRTTIFDELPPELPRVMSVGRLDLNSEGLLLLTNDGGLKRNWNCPRQGGFENTVCALTDVQKKKHLSPCAKGS